MADKWYLSDEGWYVCKSCDGECGWPVQPGEQRQDRIGCYACDWSEPFEQDPIPWICDACDSVTFTPYFEEGDRVECELCNIRGDAIDYYRAKGRVDIPISNGYDDYAGDFLAYLVDQSIIRRLSLG